MKILISNANNQPIYEQIYTQIRNQILSGELAPGQGLPSIRALAKDLRVSVITTKRAYEELEKGGYVYTVPAKGSSMWPSRAPSWSGRPTSPRSKSTSKRSSLGRPAWGGGGAGPVPPAVAGPRH